MRQAEKRRGGGRDSSVPSTEDADAEAFLEAGRRRNNKPQAAKRRVATRFVGLVLCAGVLVASASFALRALDEVQTSDRGHGHHRAYDDGAAAVVGHQATKTAEPPFAGGKSSSGSGASATRVAEEEEEAAAAAAAKRRAERDGAARKAKAEEREALEAAAAAVEAVREREAAQDQAQLAAREKAPLLLLASKKKKTYKWADMPPLDAPRLDPYLIKRLHEASASQKLDKSTCDHQRKSIPVHAEALDLVKLPREESSAPRSLPRLMCVIYTYHANHHGGALASAETWLSRCDGALVLSDANETEAGIVAVPHEGPEEYNNIWQKTRANWRYIYEYYRNDFDFWIFGGDDMFIIPQNLKAYLRAEFHDPAEPLFLGRRFRQNGNADRTFNSGGSGYVLNRPSLKLLYDALDQGFCQPHLKGFWEDVMVAQCLKKGPGHLDPYDTRDPEGRERFHPFSPGQHLTYPPPRDDKHARQDWYYTYSIDLKFGKDCCSPGSVAFHYIKPDLMRKLDALLNRCA